MAEVSTALLLIAHGSRESAANDDLRQLADELRATGRYGEVVAAFLELAEPDIDAGGAACVTAGAGKVALVPYFLSAGVHVRRDLTAARDRLAAKFAGIEFGLAEPLGPHPLLTRIVIERAEAVSKVAPECTDAGPLPHTESVIPPRSAAASS
jgi:sirohydrochlorin ferrochelatase